MKLSKNDHISQKSSDFPKVENDQFESRISFSKIAKLVEKDKWQDYDYDENSLSKDIELHIYSYFASHCKNHAPETGLYDRVMKEVERILICASLSYVEGNKSRAAEILGINRNTLSRKVKELLK